MTRYMPWCLKQARLRSHNETEREDLLSVAMECVWQAHARCAPGANPMALMWAIFNRRCIDAARRKRCRRKHETAWPSYGGGDPVNFIDSAQYEPWQLVSAEEEVARWVDPDTLAAPCTTCGTTGGYRPRKCKRPSRAAGKCHNCYCTERKKRQGVDIGGNPQ